MTKVYVVTSGEYSDYYIHAVFSTKEKAEHWIMTQFEEDMQTQQSKVNELQNDLVSLSIDEKKEKHKCMLPFKSKSVLDYERDYNVDMDSLIRKDIALRQEDIGDFQRMIDNKDFGRYEIEEYDLDPGV